jgi:Kef-type K+ transport system membrane component KefB
MGDDLILYSLFLVFAGAALIATVALYARQSLLIAYIALGILLGPGVAGLVTDLPTIQQIGHVGIIFLLFLLGLNLNPQDLLHMLRKTTMVTLLSSSLFALVGTGLGLLTGFAFRDSLVIGAAMMFSSTIIGLKLLPTTVLHHQHAGEVMVSILLLQDIIAIVIMLGLHGLGRGDHPGDELALLVVSLPLLALAVFATARLLLSRLLKRFDKLQEYLFLVAIGWCLGIARLGHALGLSYEIGAFIAGVSLAAQPISQFISESLKPLRDFFLVMFFFSLGAAFDLQVLPQVLWPALLLAITVLLIKPVVFQWLLARSGETPKLSWEMGTRLGQISEFSLLIAFVAMQSAFVGARVAYLIQLTTLLTFIASSYFIVMRYPTPIAVSDRLRRD